MGPLVAAIPRLAELVTPASLLNVKIFKNNAKKCMLSIQSIGDADIWTPDNFSLFNIPGLRKSARLNQTDCKLYNLENPPSI